MTKHVLEELDPRVLGRSLQQARNARDLTQEQAATEIGLARTTLVAIEKGERRVKPTELIKLAKLYGRSVSSFVGRTAIEEDLVPQFRTAWSALIQENARLLEAAAELQGLAGDYAALEDILGKPLPRLYPPEYSIQGSPEHAAEAIAAAERNRLGLGDGPIANLRGRLESDVGLRIFHIPIEAKVAGLFAYNDHIGACIAINANHPQDRRQWSLAHEYGHFLTSRYQTEITLLPQDGRKPLQERLADSFARYFLMPAAGLVRRFAALADSEKRDLTLADVFNIAHLYQVSVQAMVLRLEELDRLAPGTWDQLAQRKLKVRRAQELLGLSGGQALPDQLPPRYRSMAYLAYRRGFLSEGQLAKFLRCDRVSARLLVAEFDDLMHREKPEGFEGLEFDADLSLKAKR